MIFYLSKHRAYATGYGATLVLALALALAIALALALALPLHSYILIYFSLFNLLFLYSSILVIFYS